MSHGNSPSWYGIRENIGFHCLAPHHASLQADETNHAIRRINLTSGLVVTIAGSPTRSRGFSDGAGTGALFALPWGIAMDGSATFAVVVSMSTTALFALLPLCIKDGSRIRCGRGEEPVVFLCVDF